MRFHHLSPLITGPIILFVTAFPYVPDQFSGTTPSSPNLAISSNNNAGTSRRADEPDASPLGATYAAAGTEDDWASIYASENEVVAAGVSLPGLGK